MCVSVALFEFMSLLIVSDSRALFKTKQSKQKKGIDLIININYQSVYIYIQQPNIYISRILIVTLSDTLYIGYKRNSVFGRYLDISFWDYFASLSLFSQPSY